MKILVFLLVSFSFGSGENFFQCSRYHKENWSRFGYEIGNTYKYNYIGVVKSSTFSKASNHEEAELLFTVEVDITPHSSFDFTMQLSNSKFKESYVNKNNLINRSLKEIKHVDLALSKHPLHFSFQNGRISTVCPGEEEKNILHIKKAILSAFQNSMPDFEKNAVVYETDINGVCETEYKIVDYNSTNFSVSKTKHLEACSHRKLYFLPWSSTSNTKSSTPKSTSLLKSLHTCTQTFDKNFILHSTDCFEDHLFQPFSNQGNGAITRLSQSLVFVKTTRKDENPTIPLNYKRETLLFDHKQDPEEKVRENVAVSKLLHTLEKKTTNGIDQDVPKIFSHLVHELQKMSSDGICNIFESIKHSPKKKKFLLDVLPLLTSVESVITMKKLYQQGEILDSQINSWLTSLVFVKDVSLSIIGELTFFLRIEEVKQKGLLSITSLIYVYCKEDAQCLEKVEIRKALKIIEAPLLSNCNPLSPKGLSEILLSLKGIGNMGFSHSVNYLRTCFSNQDSPMELRLAAIAAHRRISCAENDNLDQLEDYLLNTRQNSEIRIAAYLAAMQCASYATFARVKDVLRREEASQVGSFIWTHITNLQETSSKWKQNLKNLVGNEFLRNKFSTDFRKYSRNYEMSTFFETLNTGATVESNVIFTPESYLPKSLMLNFSLDLFGENVNMFEIGARMEGYEEIIENLFGPDGYFPEESIRNVLEGFRNSKTESDKIQELRRSFSTIHKEPNGLVYAKIFGNEISYTQFKDFQAILGSSVNSRSILDSIMKFFRHQDIDYTKSLVFLDTTYKIPTLLGFPLELSVNGTATIGLTVSGKVDLKDMWMHKVAMEGKVYASSAVEIVGTMHVDSIVTKTGLRSVTTLNSNVYVDGHAFIDQGRLVDLKFNVPKKQVKIIDVESEVFLMQGERSRAIDVVNGDVEEWQGCTQKEFNNVTGFKICSGLRYVNASTFPEAPYFPLTGKFKFFLDAQKTDDFDNYQLHLKIRKEERNYRPVYSMLLHFDTPNSKLNRKIETSYKLDCEKLTLNTKLASPFVNWELDTQIGNERDNLGFVIQTKSNNREIFLAELSLVSKFENNTWTYEPSAKFKYKDVQIAAVSGNINYLRAQKYNANLVFDGFTHDPIEILGDLHLGIKKFQLSGSIKSKEINGNTRATIVKKSGVVSIITKTTYEYKGVKEQVIDFSFKYHSVKKITLIEEVFYVFLNSTQMPTYNTLLSFNIYRDKLYFKSDGVLMLFQETWETHQLFKFLKINNGHDIGLRCSLSCTKKLIDYDLNLSYIKSDHIFKTHGLAQLSKIKRTEALIEYDDTIRENQKFNFLLYFPKQEWTVKGVLAQKTLEKYNFYFESFYEINGNKAPVLIIFGDYTNSTLGNFQNHTILAQVDVPKGIGETLDPWVVELSLQMSPDLFLTSSELRVNNNFYKCTIALAQNGFSGLLQINDKKLLFIHGAKEDQVLTGFLSLNIYQHFEVSLKLLLPYRQLQIMIYWDKDKDVDKKISLLIDSDVKKGLYMADLEYPRQKITTYFTLLPTQVTMNVTWGIDYFKKIYLKAGNKVYDIGGLWFVKLETPLKYLENQELQLSYYILPDNAEFKVHLSWQNQTVDLILSRMKSKSYVSGYLDVNTTIPEISKIGFAMHHDRKYLNGELKIKNDGVMIFNNHQITGQSLWKSNQFNVSTNFEIVSSGLFAPVHGSLLIHNSETANIFNGTVKWKDKRVSVDYNLENQKFRALVTTPFRGFENTNIKYAIVSETDKLFLDVQMNIFKHYNRARFSWSYDFNKSLTELGIISPLVGGYNIALRHSTIYGHLDEHFIITQDYDNEIVCAELKGDVISILDMNVTASIKVLKQEAFIIVRNAEAPINSLIMINWNKQYIKNGLSISLQDKRVVELDWNFSSTLLSENATCKYLQNDNTYLISIELPRHLKFKNVFTFKDFYKKVDNALSIETLLKNWSFHYFHTLSPDLRKVNSEIFFSSNNNESRFILQGHFNNNFSSVASLQLRSPLNRPLLLNFSLVRNHEMTWNPHFYVEYDNDKVVNINSYVDLNYLDSTINISFTLRNYTSFDTVARYDLSANPKTANVELSKENLSLQVISEFYLEHHRGSLNFNVTLTNSENSKSLISSNLRYNLENTLAQGNFEVLLPEHKHNFRLIGCVISNNGTHQADISLTTTIREWEKVYCNFLVSFPETEGYFIAGVNDQNVIAKYDIKTVHEDAHHTEINVHSFFDFIKNGSLSTYYHQARTSRNVNVFGLFGNHKVILQSHYDFNTKTKNGTQFSSIYGKLNGKYHNYAVRDSELYNIKLKIFGKGKINQTSALITTQIDSNIPYFKQMRGEAAFKYLNDGHSVEGSLSYNNKDYHLHEHLQKENDSWLAVIVMSTPSFVGNFSGTILCGDTNNMVITAMLRDHTKWYNVSITSEYESLLNTDTVMVLTLPKSKYEGRITNFISSSEMDSKAAVIIGKNRNIVNVKIKYPSLEKLEATVEALLPSTQYSQTELNVFYDFSSRSRSSWLQIDTNYGYQLNGVLDARTLTFNLRTPSTKKDLVIRGTHNLDGAQNFFISYTAFFNNNSIQVYILHQSLTNIKINVDIQSSYRDWKRVSFLHIHNDTDFQAQLYFGDQKSILQFKKGTLFHNQTILLVHHKNYGLNLWSGKEKTLLTVAVPSTTYKIQTNYITNARQYGFAVLQDEIALIDVGTEISDRDDYLQFKTKVTDRLFLNYSDITFFLTYELSEFNFVVTNKSETVFSIRFRSERSMYRFNLNSGFDDLQVFQASLKVDEIWVIQVFKKRYGLEQMYELAFSFMPEKHQTALKINVPWHEHHYLLDFSLKEDLVKLHVETPFNQWRDLKFLVEFVKKNNFLSGQMQIQKNEACVLTQWVLEKTNGNVFGFFNIKGTESVTLDKWQNIFVNTTIGKERSQIIFEIDNIKYASMLNTQSIHISGTFANVQNAKLFVKHENLNKVRYTIDSKIKIGEDDTVKLLLNRNDYTTGIILQNKLTNFSRLFDLNLSVDNKLFFGKSGLGFNYKYDNNYSQSSSANIYVTLPLLGHVTMQTTFDKKNQFLKIDLDQQTLVQVLGTLENSTYFMNMNLTGLHHNGTVQGELDYNKSVAKIKGSGNWKGDPINFNFYTNLNELKLIIATPFEAVRKVQFQGKRVTSLNLHNLNVTGIWNDVHVDYYGKIIIDDNITVHSQVNVGEQYRGLLHFDMIKLGNVDKMHLVCYYPTDKKKYEIFADLETTTNKTNFNFEAKTPSKTVSRLLVGGSGSPNTLRFDAVADITNKRLRILFEGNYWNSLQFDTNLEADFPQINRQFLLRSEVNNYRYGSVHIQDVTKNKNFSIRYEKLDSKVFLRCKINKRTNELELDLKNAEILKKYDILYSQQLGDVETLRARAKIEFFNKITKSWIDSSLYIQSALPFLFNLSVSEPIDKIYFRLNDTALFYLDHTQLQSPKLQLKLSNLLNSSIISNGTHFYVNINSDLLDFRDALLHTAWMENSQEKTLSIDLKNFGPIRNGKTVVKFRDKEYQFAALFSNNSAAFVNVSARILLDNSMSGIVYADLYDVKHFANCTVKRNGFSDLLIISPLLPYKILTLKLNGTVTEPSVQLFLGTNSFNILEHELGRSYIVLKSWRKGNQFYFKFDAPSNLRCSLLEIYGKVHLEKTAVIFSKNFELKSTLTDNLNLKTHVDVSTNGVKLNLYYAFPFIASTPEFGFDLYVPFSSENFAPNVFIYAPKANYSLHCIIKYVPNEFCISGGYQFISQKSNVLIHVLYEDSEFLPKIILDWNVPYVSDTPIEFVFEQKENGIDHHFSILGLKAQLFLIFDPFNNHSLNIAFPLNNKYINLSATLQYQNAENIFISAFLYHPHYQKGLGFSSNLIFDDLKKLRVNGMVSIPTVLTTEFTLAQNAFLSTDLNHYALTFLVKINDFDFDIKINSYIGHLSTHFVIDAQIADTTFLLRYDESSCDKINFLCELQTPISFLSDFRASLVFPKNLVNGINLAVSYNKKPLAHFELHTVPNNFSINFYNVFLPLSIECKYLKSNVFELTGNICWDFNSSSNSQLGGHILLGNNVSIGFVTPTRVMAFDVNTYRDSQNKYYFGRLSWFKNQEISAFLTFTNYTLKSKVIEISRVMLSFPFRTFEVTHQLETDAQYPRAMKYYINLNWASNRTSRIYMHYELVPGKILSKLFVPIWEHEIILNVDFSSSNIPLHIKTQLMYSNEINKHIIFEVFHNEDIFKTERLFTLQHPSSKVNYTIRISTNRLPHVSYGNVSISYTNYLLKRQEEIKGFLKILHKKFEVYGEVETTKNYASFLGTLTSATHNRGFFTVLKLNEKEPFIIRGIYNFKDTGSSVSLISSYGKERRYDLYAGFPSKRELTTKLSRTVYDKQVVEGLFSVKLNTSQLLSVKLLWKKDILWEYYNMILNEYSDARFIIESTGQELIDIIEDDVGQGLLVDFYNIRQNVSLYINEEMRSLSNDYLNFLTELEDGYQSNSFYYKYIQETIETVFPQSSYLKEILLEPFWDFFQEVFDELSLALQDVCSTIYGGYELFQQQIAYLVNQIMRIKQLKEEAKVILKTAIEDARMLLHRLENILVDLLEDVDQNIASIKQQCLDFFRPYLNRIEDFIMYVEQRLALLQMLVLDVLDTLQNYIINLRESKEAIKMYTLYINWLEEFHISKILEPIADVLEQTLATVINDLTIVIDDYSPYVEAIFGKYERINALPSFVEFKKSISTFSHRILWIWDHHNVTDLIKNQIHQYILNFDSYLASMVKYNGSSSDFENFFQSSNYIFQPDIGVIEITQPLPVEWDTFDSLPQFYQHPLYDKIKEKAENIIKIQKHHFSDIINAIKSYIGESSDYVLSPPTNNIAMIIGGSNFITYDKKYFRFKGNCSYILTAEFIAKTFAVEMNYDILQKGVTISTPYAILKILSNSTVLQNDNKASLPLINGSLIVTQENHEIVVDYAKSLKVTCHLYYNYCTVQLSGWLFGKVGGLLGTLDNDISTDFNLPDGSKADDIEHFAHSWQVGNCQTFDYLTPEKNVTSISPLSITLFDTLCQLFFNNVNSPLSSCFSIINPNPFYDICVNDMKDIKNPSMCSSIAAYRARCKYSSINLEMPQMCIHCNFNIGANEEIFDKTTPKSIDVVIIKEINCFNNIASLTHFTKQLNKDLVKTGYTNNRFSVVGYGSDKPYIYVSKNQVWMKAENLSLDIKLLPKIYLNNAKSISQTINYVISKLEFRPKVTKQFVVISCTSTDKDDDINDLPVLLGEKDITMHLIKLNTVKKMSQNVLYVQNKVTLNESILEDLNAVLKHEQEDMDVMSLLALSSDGTALHVNTKTKLLENRILNAMSLEVSLTAKHSPCQRCKCVSNSDGTGKVECTRCMSPIVKQLLNDYEANGIAFPE